MIRIRVEKISTLLMLALGLSLPANAIKVGGGDTDRYWQVTQEVIPNIVDGRESGKVGAVPTDVHYWRTHTSGGNIEIYDACDSNGKPYASASSSGNLSWQIKSSNAKPMDVTLDEKTQVLTITMDPNKTLWATGQRILKPQCAKRRPPASVTQYWAKEGELSFAACGPDQISATGYNCYDKESGMGHLLTTVGKSLESYRTVATPKLGDPTAKRIEAATKVCKQAAVSEDATRALADSPALTRIPEVYPGALLQGNYFQKEPTAVLAPITIDRAGGKMTINGLTFAKGKDGKPPRVFEKVESADQGDVMQGITNMLAQGVIGTQASGSFTTSQVKSLDHMAFAMGVDGRYAGVEFSAAFKADMKSEKNYVLARFTQLYYDVSFKLPSNMEDVFADGDKFKDRQNQIGFATPSSGGVPLIVSNVSYGRTIYFLASSTLAATDISAALAGAYGNKEGGQYVAGSASMTYESMMQNTEITYFVLGGEAVETLGPIGQATSSADMFKKIKEVISSAKVAQVTDKNQGLAVAYTAKYLTSNATAQMGYATSFVDTQCEIISDGFYSFSLDVTKIDDSVRVTVWPVDPNRPDDPPKNARIVYNGGGNMYGLKLDAFIPAKDQDWRVKVQLINDGGYSNADILVWETAPIDPNDLLKNPIPQPKRFTANSMTETGEPGPRQSIKCPAWNLHNCPSAVFQLNRKTGVFVPMGNL